MKRISRPDQWPLEHVKALFDRCFFVLPRLFQDKKLPGYIHKYLLADFVRCCRDRDEGSTSMY